MRREQRASRKCTFVGALAGVWLGHPKGFSNAGSGGETEGTRRRLGEVGAICAPLVIVLVGGNEEL